MATDVFDLAQPVVTNDVLLPCDEEIFKTGKEVAMFTGGARLLDRFVKEVAEYSGQKVDWHYAGGRARVLTTGDVQKVRDAIDELSITRIR